MTSSNSNRIFRAADLKKSFGKTEIFRNINFDFREGDRIALVGYNGVGKTTLINMICGLSPVTAGEIQFSDKKHFFKHLGIHFQSGNYPHGVRVCDLIWLYSYAYKIDLSVSKFFREFKIDQLFKKKLNSISFGQLKRLELFLIMAAQNKYLILDEITAGMDIWIRFQLLQSLSEYAVSKKISLIYISHNYNEIEKLCNRLLIMTPDGIVEDCPIKKGTKVEKIIEAKFQKIKIL